MPEDRTPFYYRPDGRNPDLRNETPEALPSCCGVRINVVKDDPICSICFSLLTLWHWEKKGMKGGPCDHGWEHAVDLETLIGTPAWHAVLAGLPPVDVYMGNECIHKYEGSNGDNN